MTHKPVIIVGGGVIGVATLYELVTQGRTAILLDAAPALAEGASHANGCVLHPSLPNPWNSASIISECARTLFSRAATLRVAPHQLPHLFFWGLQFLRHATPHRHWQATCDNYRLAAYSTQQTRALIAKHNLTIEQCDVGMIKIFNNIKALQQGVAMAEKLKTLGLAYDIPDADTLARREPTLAQTAFAGAIHFKGDMIGDAHQFVTQLAAHATQHGGTILLNHKVSNFIIKGDCIYGVQCGNQTLEGDVVLAAGHATPYLAQQAGIALAVRPAKGYSLTFTSEPTTPMPTYPIVDDARHIAITPFTNRIRVLGMADFTGTDNTIPPYRVKQLARFLTELYPQFESHKGKAWAGLRPMSADGRPFIGATKIKGLWLNCGHGHLGWTMAVGSARLLVAQMAGGNPLDAQIDGDVFLPHRPL